MEVFNSGGGIVGTEGPGWIPQSLKDLTWADILNVQWQITFDWTWLIDGFGVFLAIVGLFNLGPRLQTWSETVVEYAQYYEHAMRIELGAIWPLHKSGWFLMKEAVKETWEYLLILPFAYWISGNWSIVSSFFGRLPIWGLVILALCYPLIALAVWLAIHLFCVTFGVFLSTVIRRLCIILNYPPSGVLGALGLVITVVSVVIYRL